MAPRQLQQWYRTLDRLRACKEETGTRCFSRCVTLFSPRVNMAFHDLTSIYFEGQGRPISAPMVTAATASRAADAGVMVRARVCNGCCGKIRGEGHAPG
jgi:hypothetical protein